MLNRRGLLQASSFGFGMLALKGLMAEEVIRIIRELYSCI